ncbi:MAG: succinate dehydrogenase [Acidobacteria bacterium]|nr:MAG: succinate dehydrogenase [Acidobacteriota bacterium]REK02011.1 MAG: succinate dehydrogenase [Acidobacteriota bacterium]REK14969.1 MAG: succinate dehydrogenase [Acidobacteriota bacterium]REK45683.1 MAG: succinate dehydrogenase [Acidobacteriota bacterium]
MAGKLSTKFILRKLHQITGIVPLGIFFAVHMFTNAKAMNGPEVFNDAVADIHHLPFLLLIEIFGIFLPLAYHSVYGLFITREARNNISQYGYGRNWLYVFQRVSGIFLFVFLLFHLLHFRWGLFASIGLTGTAVAGNADQAFSIVAGDFQNLAVLAFYVFGVFATAWHLGYGIFLFAVDWGLVIGERAQKATLAICAAVAFGLFAAGTNAAFSFVRPCGLLPQVFCEQPAESVPALRSEEF